MAAACTPSSVSGMQGEDPHNVLNRRQQFLFKERQSIRFWQCVARICKVLGSQSKWLLWQAILRSLFGFFQSHITDRSLGLKPIFVRHLHKIRFLESLRFELPRQLCFRLFGAKPTFVTIRTILKFKLIQKSVYFVDTIKKKPWCGFRHLLKFCTVVANSSATWVVASYLPRLSPSCATWLHAISSAAQWPMLATAVVWHLSTSLSSPLSDSETCVA